MELRPHHITIISIYKTAEESKLNHLKNKLEKLYGNEFKDKFLEVIDSINGDTLVEIVNGLDHICDTCSCPYVKYCKIEDYDSLKKEMIKRYPEIIGTKFGNEDPEIADKDAIERFNIKYNKTYRFGDLIDNFLKTK